MPQQYGIRMSPPHGIRGAGGSSAFMAYRTREVANTWLARADHGSSRTREHRQRPASGSRAVGAAVGVQPVVYVQAVERVRRNTRELGVVLDPPGGGRKARIKSKL